ncbi:DMT family transporter [Arcobacteraceae bacterium]|nr:DMT family transporter [Arcobacteraceae bacterium]
MKPKPNKNILVLIIVSVLFLALNSILCKTALIEESIDPYSFTFFRLFSAMIMLIILVYYKHKKIIFHTKKNWTSSFMLFLYAITFSYAYMNIDAGFGTLLLFGIVQTVMIASSIYYKERLTITKAFGILLSTFGLVYMLYPQENFEVSTVHALFMIVSGFSWAIYTILGKSSTDSLGNTADNFIKATLFITIFYFIFTLDTIHFNSKGLLLAIISGSITSAIGYIIWYQILPNIKIVTASVIQLFVPIIAIILSVIFLDEALSMDLFLSTILVLSGIILTIYSKKQKVSS